MEILAVTGNFPPDIGGPASYLPGLGRALARRGHRMIVVTLSDRVDHDDSWAPFVVERLRRGRLGPGRVARTVRALTRLGRATDVLFAIGLYPEAVVAATLLGKPLVQWVGGDWVWERARNRGWTEATLEEFEGRRHGLRVATLLSDGGRRAQRARAGTDVGVTRFGVEMAEETAALLREVVADAAGRRRRWRPAWV